MNLPDLSREIHASNVTAGWWTDIKSKDSILATRNRPEMLMLGVSELAEAADGLEGKLDDKLPHLPMFEVELADFVIRQLDQIGAEVSLGAATMPAFDNAWTMAYVDDEFLLLALVKIVARAMEHYRKGRVQEYVDTMAEGVVEVVGFCENGGIALFDIIAQKRAFNATRADHQIANRQAAGGKAF